MTYLILHCAVFKSRTHIEKVLSVILTSMELILPHAWWCESLHHLISPTKKTRWHKASLELSQLLTSNCRCTVFDLITGNCKQVVLLQEKKPFCIIPSSVSRLMTGSPAMTSLPRPQACMEAPIYLSLPKGNIHPWRLTWNIIMEVWKIIFLSKWVICRFHVNLPGCIPFYWVFNDLNDGSPKYWAIS